MLMNKRSQKKGMDFCNHALFLLSFSFSFGICYYAAPLLRYFVSLRKNGGTSNSELELFDA